MAGIKTLLVGTHQGCMAALVSFFKAHAPRIQLAGQAQNIPAGLAQARQLKPDLLLVDFRLRAVIRPVLVQAFRLGDSPAVIVLSGDGSDEYRQAAFAAGAHGCIRRAHPEELVPFIGRLTGSRRLHRSRHGASADSLLSLT